MQYVKLIKKVLERPLLDHKRNYFRWSNSLTKRLQLTFWTGHHSTNKNFSPHVRMNILISNKKLQPEYTMVNM